MALKKGFLTPDIGELNISRKRLIIGLVIWLFFSSGFYSFLCLIRAGFRFITVSDFFPIWVFTEDELFFYNLFFAFLSAILAQSIFMVFLIQKPKPVFHKSRFRRTDIFNDHTFLVWNLMSWFSRVGFGYGILMGVIIAPYFGTFSLYENHKYIFVLIIIVLLFSSWNSTLKIFKRKAYKWFALSLISISILSFIMAKIEVIDNDYFGEQLKNQNVFLNYEVDRVESDVYSFVGTRDLVENIYLVYPKQKDNLNKPLIIFNNQIIDLDNLKETLKQQRIKHNECDRKFLSFNMAIHKDIPMSLVNEVKFIMSTVAISKISYSIIPKDIKIDTNYLYHYGFHRRFPILGNDFYPRPKSFIRFMKSKAYEENYAIKQLNATQCTINDTVIEMLSLYHHLQSICINDSKSLFTFYINENLNFSNYFEIVSTLSQVIKDLQNEYSLFNYSKHYYELDMYQQREVRNVYSERILEISPNLIEFIEQENLE